MPIYVRVLLRDVLERIDGLRIEPIVWQFATSGYSMNVTAEERRETTRVETYMGISDVASMAGATPTTLSIADEVPTFRLAYMLNDEAGTTKWYYFTEYAKMRLAYPTNRIAAYSGLVVTIEVTTTVPSQPSTLI